MFYKNPTKWKLSAIYVNEVRSDGSVELYIIRISRRTWQWKFDIDKKKPIKRGTIGQANQENAVKIRWASGACVTQILYPTGNCTTHLTIKSYQEFNQNQINNLVKWFKPNNDNKIIMHKTTAPIFKVGQ